MTTTLPPPGSVRDAHVGPDQDARSPWVRLLAWSVGVVIAADVIVMALIGFPVPFLAVPVLLAAAGLLLLRHRERAGVIVLGVLGLLGLLLYGPALPDYLQHPESGVDFVHTAVAAFGRLIAVIAAVAVLRGAPGAGARRLGAVSVGLLAVLSSVGLVATIASSGARVQPGDVVATLEKAAFPENLAVASGNTLHLENTDRFRHTFTVAGTPLNIELPALQGVRIPIGLAQGSYTLTCAIPGHEFMDSTLTVR